MQSGAGDNDMSKACHSSHKLTKLRISKIDRPLVPDVVVIRHQAGILHSRDLRTFLHVDRREITQRKIRLSCGINCV